MMAEQEEFDMASQYGSFAMDSEDSSLTESQQSLGASKTVGTMGMMTTRSQGSLRSGHRSVKSHASELGIKFGDIPTHSEAPVFSFGNSDRATRAKVSRLSSPRNLNTFTPFWAV